MYTFGLYETILSDFKSLDMALFRQTLRLTTMTRSVPVALYHEKVGLDRGRMWTRIYLLFPLITGYWPLWKSPQCGQDGSQENQCGHRASGGSCLWRCHETANWGDILRVSFLEIYKLSEGWWWRQDCGRQVQDIRVRVSHRQQQPGHRVGQGEVPGRGRHHQEQRHRQGRTTC